MAELPYDVWLHIISFLHREEARRLLSVNRTLFSISLDEHYKTTYIGFPAYGTPPGPKQPQLHDSIIAPHVRTLELRTGPPCRISKGTRHSKGWIEQFKTRVALALSLHERPKGIQAAQEEFISMDVIRNLKSVTALVIQLSSFADPKFHPFKLAILDNSWSTFAYSLRSLSLQTPLEDLAVIIPRDIKFVQLEKFELNVSITYRTSDVDELMRKVILPFLTTHKDTLEFLGLNAAEESFDISSFLKEIPHIPHLSSFRLNQTFTNSDPTALSGHHCFLQIHHAHLRDLDMRFTPWYSLCSTTETWFTQAWCHVRLPKLRSLSLYLPQRPAQDARGAIPSLLQYAQTLTTLSLKPCRFSYEAASILLPQLGAGVLRSLELFVLAVSPDLLRLFAQHMPQLHSLKLDAAYYSPEKDAKLGVLDRTSRFCEAMQLVRFPDWKLYDLQLEPFFKLLHWDELLLAIGVALPRVQRLCGRLRLEQGFATCGFS